MNVEELPLVPERRMHAQSEASEASDDWGLVAQEIWMRHSFRAIVRAPSSKGLSHDLTGSSPEGRCRRRGSTMLSASLHKSSEVFA